MGIMSAYTLQKHLPKATITLIDKENMPAYNASFIAGGMLSPLSELDHMPREYLGAGFASIKQWSAISAEHNNPFEFQKNGSLCIAHDKDHYILKRFKSILPQPSKQWTSLAAKEIHETEQHLPQDKFHHGLYMHEEAHLHPQKAIETLLKTIKNKKKQQTTLQKERKNADLVIDCRGMGAQSEQTTLRGVKGETLTVYNPDFNLTRPLRLMHPRYPLYIVPRDNNIFMIGATIIESENKDTLSIRSGMELMSALYSIHKSFGDAEILEMNAGIRPSYPDNLPKVTQEDNIITANGLYRHGFLFAPIMAEIILHKITNTPHELAHLFTTEEHRQHENYSERSRKTA